MGGLEEYRIILSTIDYNDDPMKFGRIKCTIPGVIHAATSTKEAMPWIRPFKMDGYQTFSKPNVGQKVWVLMSKTNYDEYWWFPYFETSDLVQDYLNANYENQPDVFNARSGSAGDAIFTYDDENGYTMKLGDNLFNMHPKGNITLSNQSDTHMKIEDNKVYCGQGGVNSHQRCVMGDKCEAMRRNLSACFATLEMIASGPECSPFVQKMGPVFHNLSEQITEDILAKNTFVN